MDYFSPAVQLGLTATPKRQDNADTYRYFGEGGAGHNVWLDRSAIQGGSRWQEEIVRGIDRADVFLVMLSPESVQSENIERELGLTYVRNKAIPPVVLHGVETPLRLQWQVRVTLEKRGATIQVRFEDQGMGISPEHLPRIFERFYRAAPSNNGEAHSGGLGLAIAQAISRAQGGHIECHSKLGTGSTFTVVLPDVYF